tara:strand:- start:350 stop:664 length:315 start_codon:yes stop_codon:yes gene_type:complete
MAKIIQFPKATLKHQMEKSLEDMRGSLKEMYEALEKIDKGYKAVEAQAHEMEDSYQTIMKMYIEEVGFDKVPLEWLEYCPYVGMERDADGKITITLIDPPETKK